MTLQKEIDALAKTDEKQVDQSTQELVKLWTERIKAAKDYHKDAFKRMREDIEFALGNQSPEEFEADDYYTANWVLRHVNNKTATLYAKDPKIKAETRQKMVYQVWSGDPSEIAQAKEAIQAMAEEAQIDPTVMQDVRVMGPIERAQAVIADYEQGKSHSDMLEKVGKTMERLLAYFWNEVPPTFKSGAKVTTRRAVTSSVGWCKVGFQRKMGRSPDTDARIEDCRAQLDRIEQLMAEQEEGSDQWSEDSAKAAELKAMMESLMQAPEIVLTEGLVYSWPKSTSVILDPETTSIVGFVGTRWLAQEYYYSSGDIQQIYGVNVESGSSKPSGVTIKAGDDTDSETLYRDWEIYDRESRLVYVVCDGQVKTKRNIYPPSDVRLLRSPQLEYNRARHGLREHRLAARPGMAVAAGKLTETDKELLASRPANALVEVAGLAPGDDIRALMAPIPYAPLDPNLYETSYLFDDTMRVVGIAEANIGGTAGNTATESSIAESTRQVGIGSNVDDVDEWLTSIARASGQILLSEMSEEKVREICGPGAVWPTLTQEQIMREVFLTIEAGSSGKPNKALELANWEKMMPFLIQIPGLTSKFILKETLKRMDDSLSIEEAYQDGVPSIAAQNNMAGPEGANGIMGGAQNMPGPVRGGGGGPDVATPTAHQGTV